MKTSFVAILAAAAGLAAADNLDIPDCAKGCLNDGLQKAGCTQDNIKDCYCPKADVNTLVNCVTGACKDQNDLLKAAQAAQKACPNGTGNFNFGNGNGNGNGNGGGGGNGGGNGNGGGGNFNNIPGFPGNGNGGGNNNGGGGNNGGGNNGGNGNGKKVEKRF
ncbi:hypothetical protein C8034_v000261 [Colletotrichum sidae]|uniref:CFEM domain-containing protein n=1 Tax=Colletotrichum sidae TaxID=1347389 RepID=A0A4R8TGH3_9PEZI|nr:hypothetical protein C8034_v000261 [Colletotrichum sidae]